MKYYVVQYCTISCNIVQYCAISCNTVQHLAFSYSLCNNAYMCIVQDHYILCNIMQYGAITWKMVEQQSSSVVCHNDQLYALHLNQPREYFKRFGGGCWCWCWCRFWCWRYLWKWCCGTIAWNKCGIHCMPAWEDPCVLNCFMGLRKVMKYLIAFLAGFPLILRTQSTHILWQSKCNRYRGRVGQLKKPA